MAFCGVAASVDSAIYSLFLPSDQLHGGRGRLHRLRRVGRADRAEVVYKEAVQAANTRAT